MSGPMIVEDVHATVSAGARAVAVVRHAPTVTILQLPSVADQGDGNSLSVFDWSDSATEHAITLLAADGETIMLQPSAAIYSNPAQLGAITLAPAVSLKGWYLA